MHAPDGDLEFGPVKVQLRPDQVDIRPVGLLDQVGGLDLQGFHQRVIEGQGTFAPVHPTLVVGPQMGGVMPRDQRKHRRPFIRHATAKDRGHRALTVEVDDQHAVAIQRGRHRKMCASGGLAHAPLEIGNRHDLGGQLLWAPRQVVLRFRPLGREMCPQDQHVVKTEPLRPALGL